VENTSISYTVLNILFDTPSIEFAGSFSHEHKTPAQTALYLPQSRHLGMACSLAGQQVLCPRCACATTAGPVPATDIRRHHVSHTLITSMCVITTVQWRWVTAASALTQ